MHKYIGRIVFAVTALLLFVYVEIGWSMSRFSKAADGMSEVEFVEWESAKISWWEAPLVGLVWLVIVYVLDDLFLRGWFRGKVKEYWGRLVRWMARTPLE